MLIADNFHLLMEYNLKIIPHFTIPLHILRADSKGIKVAKERNFLIKTWLCIPYLAVMMYQWLRGWSQNEALPVLLQSMFFTTAWVNSYFIVAEHYRWRREIASLYNSFLDFEIRLNCKHMFLKYLKYLWIFV